MKVEIRLTENVVSTANISATLTRFLLEIGNEGVGDVLYQTRHFTNNGKKLVLNNAKTTLVF
jgi:hypothetical protein